MILDSEHRIIILANPHTQWDRLEWCKLNLAGEVHSRPITHGDDESELWYFETAGAATMFALKWS